MAASKAIGPRHEWSATARRLGILSAVSVVAVGLLYVATISAWLLIVARPREPIGDPFLAVMEVLTVLSALAFLVLVLAIRCFAEERHKVHSLVSSAFGTLAVGCTVAVHFVQLTAVRQLWRTGARGDYRLIWPSDLFAVEYLAWDLLIGLTLVLASLVFFEPRTSRPAGVVLMTSGLLCILGLGGPLSGNMIWQYIAVMGYAIMLPIAAALVARIFYATPPHDSTAYHPLPTPQSGGPDG